jgi:hypothetical protein
MAFQVGLQNQYTFSSLHLFFTVVNVTFVLYSGDTRLSLNSELFFYVNEDWISETSYNNCTNNLVFVCFLVFLYALKEWFHIA